MQYSYSNLALHVPKFRNKVVAAEVHQNKEVVEVKQDAERHMQIDEVRVIGKGKRFKRWC